MKANVNESFTVVDERGILKECFFQYMLVLVGKSTTLLYIQNMVFRQTVHVMAFSALDIHLLSLFGTCTHTKMFCFVTEIVQYNQRKH